MFRLTCVLIFHFYAECDLKEPKIYIYPDCFGGGNSIFVGSKKTICSPSIFWCLFERHDDIFQAIEQQRHVHVNQEALEKLLVDEKKKNELLKMEFGEMKELLKMAQEALRYFI